MIGDFTSVRFGVPLKAFGSFGGEATPANVDVPAVAATGQVVAPSMTTGADADIPVVSATGQVIAPITQTGLGADLSPIVGTGSVIVLTVEADKNVSLSPVVGLGTSIAPDFVANIAVLLPAVSGRGFIIAPIFTGGLSPIPPPGDSGEWCESYIWLTARVWEYDNMAGGTTKPKERMFLTTRESKTFGFSVAHEGALRGGDTIDPLNPGEIFFDPVGPRAGDVELITQPFFDSDGKRIRSGKGVKCRILPPEDESVGVFNVVVRINTVGGDILEVDGELEITETI